MSKQITVHIIANAHLDPVWLWPWQAGLDEVLCTCRTMCNLLDDYKDAVFTAGEAWRYQQIEMVEPGLLERIRKHHEAGRWAFTGGWWIQPDCNFPSEIGMRRQIEAGKDYFLKTFGTWPEVGYNVDSFGHMASLPTMMHEAGQKYYVMMRPQKHEMELPARLFRWREKEDTPEILTFRLPQYGTWNELPDESDIRASLSDLPEGVVHTMSFIGVGDHGGGPTAKMLDWVRENREAIPGVKLEFSSPDKFFAAVSQKTTNVPTVEGELQYHAIGCYSVMRGIKTRVRKAERILAQAESVAEAEDTPLMKEAWRQVAFNHFHDILGGTSLASAYPQHYDQLGAASSLADRILQHSLRKRMIQLPDCELQRIVICNASNTEFDGYVDHEPWLQKNAPWIEGGRLLAEDGSEITYQRLDPEQANVDFAVSNAPKALFRIKLAPGEIKTVMLTNGPQQRISDKLTASPSSIINPDGVGKTESHLSFAGGLELPLPRLDIIEDRTDNWSHTVDRYPEGPVSSPIWNEPFLLDNGALMAALGQTGRGEDNTFSSEWRIYDGEPWVEWRLTVNWRSRESLLKLNLPLPSAGADRTDGIPAGKLQRPNMGRECPFHDWTLIPCRGIMVGVVSPDVYALDATSSRLRLTLLRSPVLTQHYPNIANYKRAVYSDQGEHIFRFRFYAAEKLSPEYLEKQAALMHYRPLTGDLTRGMKLITDNKA